MTYVTETHAENLVQESLSESWKFFKDDIVLYMIATLLTLAVSAFSLGLLFGPMVVGLIQLIDKRTRGEAATATDVFGGFSQFGASLVAMILIGIGVFVGILLLVIPGLLFSIATAFTFHAIALDDMSATQAIGQSVNLLKNNLAPCGVLLIIVFVLNVIGGSVVLGTLLTTPFSLILMTLAYKRLTGSDSGSLEASSSL